MRLLLFEACCVLRSMQALVHSVLLSHVSHLHHSQQLVSPHQVVTVEGLVGGKK